MGCPGTTEEANAAGGPQARTNGAGNRISLIYNRGNRQGASLLRRRPLDPLPLSELIFLYKDDDIRAWLLANPGKDLLDLLVLEARLGQDDRDVTPAPAFGRYPFLDGKLWDR